MLVVSTKMLFDLTHLDFDLIIHPTKSLERAILSPANYISGTKHCRSVLHQLTLVFLIEGRTHRWQNHRAGTAARLILAS